MIPMKNKPNYILDTFKYKSEEEREYRIRTGRRGLELFEVVFHRQINKDQIEELLRSERIDMEKYESLMRMNESPDFENLHMVSNILNYYSNGNNNTSNS